MKNTLIVVLSGILAGSAFGYGYDREGEQELQDWCDRQDALYDARQAAARQQELLEDIRWQQARAAADAQRRHQAQMRAAQATRERIEQINREREAEANLRRLRFR